MSSAKLLITRSWFAPSIHCSYYSCIQYMIYVLRSTSTLPDDERDKEIKRKYNKWKINEQAILKEIKKAKKNKKEESETEIKQNDPSKILTESNNQEKNKEYNMHAYYIQVILSMLDPLNKNDGMEFSSKITVLKDTRRKADYLNKNIDGPEAIKINGMAEFTLGLLKKHFTP